MTNAAVTAFQEGIAPAVFLARVRRLVYGIVYRDGYRWRVEIDNANPGGRVFVELQHWREDVLNPGVMDWGPGGKRYLSPHMTDGEILRVCVGAALAYEEHEVREFFRWSPGGDQEPRAIFGPHLSVEALWSVADQLDIRS